MKSSSIHVCVHPQFTPFLLKPQLPVPHTPKPPISQHPPFCPNTPFMSQHPQYSALQLPPPPLSRARCCLKTRPTGSSLAWKFKTFTPCHPFRQSPRRRHACLPHRSVVRQNISRTQQTVAKHETCQKSSPIDLQESFKIRNLACIVSHSRRVNTVIFCCKSFPGSKRSRNASISIVPNTRVEGVSRFS